MKKIDLVQIWSDVQKLLLEKGEIDKTILDTYFQEASIYKLDQIKAIIVVDKQIVKYIFQCEIKRIQDCLIELTGYQTLSAEVYLQEELEPQDSESDEFFEPNLNKDFTFENFVEGPSNRESYRAALACASKPEGFIYTPLFIYGDSGLGKTHLLHAIGNFISDHNPNLKILYLTSDDFITAVVQASHNRTLKDLKDKMMKLDVLLIDDIQFLAGGKLTSSETLFNIYNSLKKKNKLIVITSDKKPWEIKELEERLVSRLSNGLTCCIESPEYETALKILKTKIKYRAEDIQITDDVLTLIATNYSHDVRAIEGALNRLLFYSLQFSDKNIIDMNLAKQAFGDDIDNSKKKVITISKIQKTVAEFYNMTKTMLISKNKTKAVSDARAIAIYLVKKHLPDTSFDRIGKEFGGRDHSTIMTANKKIEDRLKFEIELSWAINEIEKLLFN